MKLCSSKSKRDQFVDHTCRIVRYTNRNPLMSVSMGRAIARLKRGISSGHPDMSKFKFSLDDVRAMRAYL